LPRFRPSPGIQRVRHDWTEDWTFPVIVPMRSGKYTAFDRVVSPNDAHSIIIRLVRGE
jgi:hypothetical protein